MPGVRRVGHKGADLIAPGNTAESFEAALAAGVDMIEFDVLRLRDGGLVLAHDYGDAARRDPMTLEQGLDHFAGEAYAGVELDVDLKLPGSEREVVDGLRERGLLERSIVSTQYVESLAVLGRLDTSLRRGWSVPRVRRDYTRGPLAPLAYVAARALRRRLPRIAERMVAGGRCEAVMSHWMLVSGRLVTAVQRAGGQVYVWTVDDPRRIGLFERLGVDGIITNDPRLFEEAVSRSRVGG